MKKQFFLLPLLLSITMLNAQNNSDNPYEKVYAYSDGMAVVELEDKFGYINEEGKEVITIQYKYARAFHDGLAAVSQNGRDWGFIDKKGKTAIPFRYDQVFLDFKDGYAPVSNDGKYGMIDSRGKTVIAHKYDLLEHFQDGLAKARLGSGSNSQYGYVDDRGREIVPMKYNYLYDFSEGLALVRTGSDKDVENGLAKYGFVDRKGKETIPLVFQSAHDFHNGLAPVKRSGKWGFIDTKGTMQITPTFDYAYTDGFKTGEAKVEVDDEPFFIDRNGNRLGAGQWILSYTKGYKLGEQYWSKTPKFPEEDIKKKWDNKFYITDLEYNKNEKQWFLTMSKAGYPNQLWRTRKSYDEMVEEIKKGWERDFAITKVSYGDDLWVLVMSNTGNTGLQTIFSNSSFPEAKIKENWDKNFYITDMIYASGRWVVVMSKVKYSGQQYKTYEKLDLEDIAANEKKGYHVTSLAKSSDGKYVIVYTKGSGIKEQEFKIDDILPSRGIQGYWDKGYTLLSTYYTSRD